MNLPSVDADFLQAFLTDLLNTPSPTGFAHQAVDLTRRTLEAALPEADLRVTPKGALVARWEGNAAEAPRALTAHVDTLGAVVKEIKSSGRLKVSRIGGFPWNFAEGEGVWMHPAEGEAVPGTLLLTAASVHVYGKEAYDAKREDDTMEVRLDAIVHSAEDVAALGIRVGDFVSFEPRVRWHNGFVRSRHLDDKAAVACMVAAAKAMHDAGLKPAHTTYLHISNYEEVGHGAAAGLPADLEELVSIDMAAVGKGQTSDEFHATLCVKDSGGPYHYGLSQKLRRLAEAHGIPYKVDVYPHYGSDGEAAWRAGLDAAVALIGPGVDASHNYERTHMEALLATTRWILGYMLSE